MIEISGKNKNFDKILDNLLLQRRNKVKSESISVTNIIKDIKKNGDKALLKYEKKYNKNKIIKPNSKQISKSISFLENNVIKAIDLAYQRIYNFHSLFDLPVFHFLMKIQLF